jgi:hypothetical protein
MWYSNMEKTLIFWHILQKHWYICPIALVRRNPEYRSHLIVVSATSAPPFQPLRHQRNVCQPAVNRFTRQTLPTANRKHSLWTSFAMSPAVHKRSTTEHHFDYWNQPQNMRMRVCCLDCHEDGLCCYLVIHTENLLRQLQLFYFHLWSIY